MKSLSKSSAAEMVLMESVLLRAGRLDGGESVCGGKLCVLVPSRDHVNTRVCGNRS